MIVDTHYHLLAQEWYPKGWWDTVVKMYTYGLRNYGLEMTPEDIKTNLIPPLWDPEGEALLRDMEESGVDKTVIVPIDYWLAFQEPKGNIIRTLRAYGTFQAKHANKIIAFATVDVRRPDAVEIVERAIEEWGLKGLNLYPQTGYYPNGSQAYRVLEKASELNIPVRIHTGQQGPPPLRGKYGDPIFLDDVAQDFPNLSIIAGHMAFAWYQELFYLAGLKYNISTEFSAWQDVAKSSYPRFCEILRQALDRMGKDRVLFGTDNPFVAALMPTKEYVELIKALPQNAPEGITFTEPEVNAMLGESAAKILGLV